MRTEDTKGEVNDMATINIKGIEYIIEERLTPNDERAIGRPNLATHMEKVGMVADLVLRRIGGKKLYMGSEWANSHYQLTMSRGF